MVSTWTLGRPSTQYPMASYWANCGQLVSEVISGSGSGRTSAIDINVKN